MKGKLLKTQWLPAPQPAICYTCQYHDWEARTPAVTVRVRTYEHITEKTYFCDLHTTLAEQAEILHGCSGYPKRFNVVPFGAGASQIESEFTDSLAEAREAKANMLEHPKWFMGTNRAVDIYDTVEGSFWQ